MSPSLGIVYILVAVRYGFVPYKVCIEHTFRRSCFDKQRVFAHLMRLCVFQVKAAFTRAFNKASHATPYAVTTTTKKVASKPMTSSDSYENGEMEELEPDSEDENSEDISSNPMIRVNKPKKGAEPRKKGAEPGKKGVQSSGTKGKGKASSHSNSKKGKNKR